MRFGLIWGSYSPYTPGPFLYLWVSPDNRCLGHTLHRVLPEKGPGCRNQLSNGFLGAERRKSFCCIFSSRGMRERLQPCEEEFWLSLPHRRACSSSCRSRPLLSTGSLGHLIRSSGQRNPEHGLLSGYSKKRYTGRKLNLLFLVSLLRKWQQMLPFEPLFLPRESLFLLGRDSPLSRQLLL